MGRFILLLALLIPGEVRRATGDPEGLTCFHCGDEDQKGERPCDTLPAPAAPCPEDNYCLKILFHNGSVLRGCSTRTTAWGRGVSIGCAGPTREDTAVLRYCACDTHLCNAANNINNIWLLLLLLLGASLLLVPGRL